MPPAAAAAAGLAALAVGMGIGRFAFTPILPMMQADSGLSLPQGAWLAAANYGGYFGGALLAPFLDGERAIRAGLLAVGVLTLAMALAGDFYAWLLLRGLAGMASAWVLVHVSAWCEPRLAPAVYAGVGTGSAVAGLACVAAIALGLPSQAAWLALAVVSLGAVPFLWPAFRDGHLLQVRERTRVRWSADTVSLVVCYGLFGFGYIIPATFIPAMAREALDAAWFGWAWPVFGAAAALSTVAAGPLLRRFGNRHVWVWGHAAMALGVAAPVFLPGLAGIAVAALCVGGTFMVVTMAGMQEARRIGGAAPSLLAAMTAAFAAGQILGPVFVALVSRAGLGLDTASLTAAGLLLAGALVLLFRRPR